MLTEPAREARNELLVEMLDEDDRRREFGRQVAQQRRYGGRAAGGSADGDETLGGRGRAGGRRWPWLTGGRLRERRPIVAMRTSKAAVCSEL